MKMNRWELFLNVAPRFSSLLPRHPVKSHEFTHGSPCGLALYGHMHMYMIGEKGNFRSAVIATAIIAIDDRSKIRKSTYDLRTIDSVMSDRHIAGRSDIHVQGRRGTTCSRISSNTIF